MTGDIVLHLSFFYLTPLAALPFFCCNIPPNYTLVTSTLPSTSPKANSSSGGICLGGYFNEQRSALTSGTSSLPEPQHRQEEHQH